MKNNDFLRKTVLAGLGLFDMTKEKADEFVKELIKRGEIAESEGKEYAEEIMKKAKNFEEELSEKIENILKEKKYAKDDKVERIEKKLDEILEKLNSLWLKRGIAPFFVVNLI